MENFSGFNLHKTILINLKKEGFIKPREVQERCIPIAIENKDILALSPTASGKTVAFSVGIIQKLLSTSKDCAISCTVCFLSFFISFSFLFFFSSFRGNV